MRAADRWQTSFRSQLGQFEWNSGARSSASSAIDSRRPPPPGPSKVLSIAKWATPRSCAEVRRFTGLANYYRRFMEGHAELAVVHALRVFPHYLLGGGVPRQAG